MSRFILDRMRKDHEAAGCDQYVHFNGKLSIVLCDPVTHNLIIPDEITNQNQQLGDIPLATIKKQMELTNKFINKVVAENS